MPSLQQAPCRLPHCSLRRFTTVCAGLDLDVVCPSMGNRILLETFKRLRAASALFASATFASWRRRYDLQHRRRSGGSLSLWAEAPPSLTPPSCRPPLTTYCASLFPPARRWSRWIFPEAVGRFGHPQASSGRHTPPSTTSAIPILGHTRFRIGKLRLL